MFSENKLYLSREQIDQILSSSQKFVFRRFPELQYNKRRLVTAFCHLLTLLGASSEICWQIEGNKNLWKSRPYLRQFTPKVVVNKEVSSSANEMLKISH